MSCVADPYGATSDANAVRNSSEPTIATPNAPLGRRTTARSPAIGRSPRRRGASAAATVVDETLIVRGAPGLEPHARIEEPIREVREQVRQDEENRDHEHPTPHHRVVAGLDRVVD